MLHTLSEPAQRAIVDSLTPAERARYAQANGEAQASGEARVNGERAGGLVTSGDQPARPGLGALRQTGALFALAATRAAADLPPARSRSASSSSSSGSSPA